MQTFTFQNAIKVQDHNGLQQDIKIEAETIEEAFDILRGMDGGAAFNRLRDFWTD